MKPSEFRANAAGYLDSASVLVQTVVETFQKGQQMKDEHGRPKVECPEAIYVLLAEANAKLQKVATWLIAPDNLGLDK